MREVKKVQVAKGTIRYVEAGAGKKTVVFIHGGFGDAGLAKLLEKTLGDRYKIIVPYLPGHGSYDLDDRFSYEDLLNSLEEFICKLEVSDGVFMGHSFGARVALDLAGKHGLPAEKVIAFSPLLAPVRSTMLEMLVNLSRDYKNDLGLAHKHVQERETMPTRMRNLNNIWRLVKSVKELEETSWKMPVIIVLDEQDSALPFRDNYSVASRLKRVQVKTVPGGHYWFFKAESQEVIRRLI